MNDLVIDYMTRGGIQLAIKLPLNEYGQVLNDHYLSDSERRKLTALRIRSESDEQETMFITVH